MIASLSGSVRTLRLDGAVIEVGGVGMLVRATPSTLAGLRIGAAATLATALVVREDSLTLYGFADEDERDMFEVLQTVSGIGPRLALAMLAVHTPDALRRAVGQEDVAALMRVPGIGRKGAQRIVLELGGRLGPAQDEPVGSAAAVGPADRRGQVVDALVGLGWSAKAAQETVDGVVPPPEPVADADVADVLRRALRALGGAGRG